MKQGGDLELVSEGRRAECWASQEQAFDGFIEAEVDPEPSLEDRGWIGQGRRTGSLRGERAESNGRREEMRRWSHSKGEPPGRSSQTGGLGYASPLSPQAPGIVARCTQAF